MCDIFPDIQKCFYIIPNRTGLIFIAILSLMTGALGLSVIIKLSMTCCGGKTVVDFESIKTGFTKIYETWQFKANIPIIIRGFTVIICVLFIVLGIILLGANFLDASDVVVIFVWGIMFNVVVGFVTVNLVFYECTFGDVSMCILNGIDWFTVGFIYTAVIVKLTLWIYFAAVANTYMEDGS